MEDWENGQPTRWPARRYTCQVRIQTVDTTTQEQLRRRPRDVAAIRNSVASLYRNVHEELLILAANREAQQKLGHDILEWYMDAYYMQLEQDWIRFDQGGRRDWTTLATQVSSVTPADVQVRLTVKEEPRTLGDMGDNIMLVDLSANVPHLEWSRAVLFMVFLEDIVTKIMAKAWALRPATPHGVFELLEPEMVETHEPNGDSGDERMKNWARGMLYYQTHLGFQPDPEGYRSHVIVAGLNMPA